MEYCLSAGDGAASIWNHSPDLDLDGDGRMDAVGLDFDHDGHVDDALADLDGDGRADHAVLDVDGAGEHWFTDDGTGVWGIAADPPPRSATGLRWFGLDGVEHTGKPLSEFDTGDTGTGVRFFDSNGDGMADRALVPGDGGLTGYVDTDGDGRWDIKLTDADGDGSADAAAVLRPPT